MSELKISVVLVALTVVACVKAASIGNALLTVYSEPILTAQETDAELVRDKRDPDALVGGRGLHHHHHHHHGGSQEEYYSKPSTCYKCGGGGEGPVATFAQSSAGTISGGGGGHGGHGGLGSQSVSQSAAYNFGPFSASFSSSQSAGNGGLYGGFF